MLPKLGNLSDDDDEDGGVFEQSIASISEFFDPPGGDARNRSISHSGQQPRNRIDTISQWQDSIMTDAAIAPSPISSPSSSRNKKEDKKLAKEAAEEIRQNQIEAILQYETVIAINLRASQSEGLSRDMLARQQDDINKAFSEVNFLRAELVELYNNKTIGFFKKKLLLKYITANRKELSSRARYAELAMSAAMSDAQKNDPELLEDWKTRIESDFAVVTETRVLRNDKEISKNPVLKKKHEYDYNRAKAIYKADYAAVETAWPDAVDGGALIYGDDVGNKSFCESGSGRPSRSSSRSRANSSFSPSDIYG